MDTELENKLNYLFELSKQLDSCLSDADFEEFQSVEQEYSVKMKEIINNNEQATLQQILPHLKKIKQELEIIQQKAQQKYHELKEKALQQQRNKKKIKAYK